MAELTNRTPATLCRHGNSTCGACCWGRDVDRTTLNKRLRRQQQLAAGWSSGDELPSPVRLLWHELRARGGADLILALLLRVPWLGKLVRSWLAKRVVCAFIAFDGPTTNRVGCLLHPKRWGGRDVRRQAAFRLLPGLGCGESDYACAGCQKFARADAAQQLVMLNDLHSDDWYEYSSAVAAFSAQLGEVQSYAGDRLQNDDH